MTSPRFHELLLRWEEGDLSASEVEELSELLRRDPQARRELRLHSMMTSGISESLASAAGMSVSASPRWRLMALVGAAAAVLVGILLTFVVLGHREVPVASAPPSAAPAPATTPVPPPIRAEKHNPVPEEPKAVPAPAPPPLPEKSAAAPVPPDPAPAPTPQPPKPVAPETPAPPSVEKPVPSGEPDRKPAPAPTLTVLAKLEQVSGTVTLEKNPAKAAQEILAGQSLETGPGAEAVVVFRDQTRLSLAADSRAAELADGRITVARGTLAVDPAGPFIVQTPQAEVRAPAGAYFLVMATADMTRVDVGAGKIRLSRVADGRAVEVTSGQTANTSDLAARLLMRQDKKKKGKKDLEFEFKVNTAIQSGVNFLRGEAEKAILTPAADGGFPVELALWALQHGGLPESDPVFQKLFGHMMATELQRTYRVSLQAMILEELDRVKYQLRIAQCAQFLVDNQCKNGQWSYGEAVPLSDPTPTPGKAKKDVATPAKADSKEKEKDKREKPKVVQKIAIVRRRDGLVGGDNSNSQYAALGLRACHDAGIILPVEVLKKAQAWWRGSQEATKKLEPAGWNYGVVTPGGTTAYGSMTAGAAGSLVLYHYLLGEPWLKDDAVLKGMEWMSSRFSVSENPGRPESGVKEDYTWHYYYLYALERFGILFGTEMLGAHDWYREGATYLLKEQKGDGSWNAKPGDGFMVHDTSFAILFLRRATRPLSDVASVDRYVK